MTAALSKDPQARPPPDDMARQIEENAAEIAVLRDSVGRLELMFGKMCTALGIDPPPGPTIRTESTTMKAIAMDSGYSPTRVRQWIEAGEIKATRKGGRVLVDKASAKAFLDRKQDHAHKVGP
jgi:hypothetical protein